MSTRPPPPPSPTHILRTHNAQINVLHISADNERLYSGDLAGEVAVTSTRTLRSLAVWHAHTDGILGVEEWERNIITHGRDNQLHVWERVAEGAGAVGDSAAVPDLKTPKLLYSMDVNALNYCRFSLLRLPKREGEGPQALIALPNLVESSLADVWSLPDQKRLHAAIGKEGQPGGLDGRGPNATGIIMSLHLFEVPYPEHWDYPHRKQLRLLCAYEHGGVILWAYKPLDKDVSIEGIGWEKLWSVRLHNETVMAMGVSKDNSLAFTVSADHIIGRYDIANAEKPDQVQTACTNHRMKYPGNASISIRDDGRICAVGGWDGRVRLYSTKTMKPLGTLEYHKKSCVAVIFARPAPVGAGADENDDEMDLEEKAERARWLVVGSQDQRVSVWALMAFGKGKE